MRVLLINTSKDVGGAAVACGRLRDALLREGVEVQLLVRPKRLGFIRKAIERVAILPFVGWSWRRAWTIDTNWLGSDITQTEEFKRADVVHLHWVNHGFLTIEQIGKIARSGKKVVWTMHDLWPLDSIYHYKQESQYAKLAKSVMQRKQRAYADAGIQFVTCSRWLQNQVEDSPLLHGNSICTIPNPIDTSIFNKQDKTVARQLLGLPQNKKIILFVSQNLLDERKGARYFIEAINSRTFNRDDIAVAVLGGNGDKIAELLNVETYALGYICDQQRIARVYNAADCFVLPSLNDNLPNTIMEAMACGVPSVAFSIGGIPEMIDHKENGYIAELRNAEQLAEGITYCLDAENASRLSEACIEKVQQTYSQHAVATQFIKDIYAKNATI